MNNKLNTKLFLILMLSTVMIISLSHVGVYGYEKVFTDKNAKIFSEGTILAGIDLSGKTQQEATSIVVTEIEKWKQQKKIALRLNDKEIEVYPEVFKFNINESLGTVENTKSSPLQVEVDQGRFRNLLNDFLPEDTVSLYDFDKLTGDVANPAKTLSKDEHVFSMTAYWDHDLPEPKIITLAKVEKVISKDDISIVRELIEPFKNVKLESQEVFSLMENVESAELFSDKRLKALNIISSSMYETVLSTNLTILERHLSRELPNYIELGFEAKVSPEKENFVFENSSDQNLTMELGIVNNRLIVEIKGYELENKYTVELKDKKVIEPKTIARFTAALLPGEVRVEDPGAPARFVNVYQHVLDQNDVIIDTIHISEDFYPSVYKIEMHSMTPKPEEEEKEDSSDSKNDEIDDPQQNFENGRF